MLPELNIDLVHGRMSAAEKEAVMMRFKNNEIHVLVATTVIEVGVDVPNASVMIIENAERLGLSQLHQLRGRVGRGNIASFCLLLYQPPLSLISKERLSIIRDSTDGFYIAERDLQIRGPGEVLGTKQTGDIAFRLADFMRDRYLFGDVDRVANALMLAESDKARMIITRWMGHRVKYKKV